MLSFPVITIHHHHHFYEKQLPLLENGPALCPAGRKKKTPKLKIQAKNHLARKRRKKVSRFRNIRKSFSKPNKVKHTSSPAEGRGRTSNTRTARERAPREEMEQTTTTTMTTKNGKRNADGRKRTRYVRVLFSTIRFAKQNTTPTPELPTAWRVCGCDSTLQRQRGVRFLSSFV